MFTDIKKKLKDYKVVTDNLAVPEIHTGEEVDVDDKAKDETITYDNVAIPEIHIGKKKKNP